MRRENDYVVMVDEHNKLSMHQHGQDNVLYYFELKEWHAGNAFRNFSIKLVLDGFINYKIGNTTWAVGKNQALVGNKQPLVESFFESKKPVKSVCLNIGSNTFNEAFALLASKKDPDLDRFLENRFVTPGFEERLYHSSHDGFLRPLQSLAYRLAENKSQPVALNQEFFLQLSEDIVLELFNTTRSYEGLDCIRVSTKKEILKRLDMARAYLEENFLKRPTITELSRFCSLSEFHFFRAFKQAYRISPYQYQLKLRLEKARDLINHSNKTISSIAGECAFPDLSSFSKAYKKMFGKAPSAAREYPGPLNRWPLPEKTMPGI